MWWRASVCWGPGSESPRCTAGSPAAHWVVMRRRRGPMASDRYNWALCESCDPQRLAIRRGRAQPSGSSSVGRASAFQAECRGFETRLPLHFPFRAHDDTQPFRRGPIEGCAGVATTVSRETGERSVNRLWAHGPDGKLLPPPGHLSPRSRPDCTCREVARSRGQSLRSSRRRPARWPSGLSVEATLQPGRMLEPPRHRMEGGRSRLLPAGDVQGGQPFRTRRPLLAARPIAPRA